MRHSMRICAALVMSGLFVAAASQGVAQSPSRGGSQTPLLNTVGQPLMRGGAKLGYQANDMKGSNATGMRASEPVLRNPRTAVGEAGSVWAWTALGTSIGYTGLFSTTVGSETVVIAGSSPIGLLANSSWAAMKVGPDGVRLEPYFRSPAYASSIVEIFHMPATATLPDRVVVTLIDGSVIEHRTDTMVVVASYKGPCAGRGGLLTARASDLNGDSIAEQISLCSDASLVAHDRSTVLWSVASIGGSHIAVGQMDDDASMEIASTSGKVVDVATRRVQWASGKSFGDLIEAADIDGDGRDEIVAASFWDQLNAYDVELKQPKWSLRRNHNVTAMNLADVDADGIADVLIGDGQWGSVHVLDGRTKARKGSIANPGHSVTRILVRDLNKDNRPEILFGAGFANSGADHLYIADWQSRTVVWQNEDLVGPFIGPEIGDLDGDGVPEIVFASYESESGFGSGRIIVMDSKTNQVRAISKGVAGNFSLTGLRDIKLRDVNGDGRLDIMVATDYLREGVIEVYSFDQRNLFSLIWTNAARPFGSPFQVVDFADLDGDGRKEIVAGNAINNSNSPGAFIYVYDLATRQESWRTSSLPTDSTGVTGMLIGDIDGDSRVEILAFAPSLGVYVFDGPTHGVESVLQGSFTSMGFSSTGLTTLGTATGSLTSYNYDGKTLIPGNTRHLLSSPVSGFTDLGKRGLWIGSEGVLRKFNSNSTLKAQTGTYGPGTGRRTVLHPDGRHVLTCTQEGLQAFLR